MEESCYAECHLCSLSLTLSAPNSECHYAECRYAECRFADCRGAQILLVRSYVNTSAGQEPILE